jgi:hypothetical protein
MASAVMSRLYRNHNNQLEFVKNIFLCLISGKNVLWKKRQFAEENLEIRTEEEIEPGAKKQKST